MIRSITSPADRARSDLDPDRTLGRDDGPRHEIDESTGLVGSFVPGGAKTAHALFAHSGYGLHGMVGSAGKWMTEHRALSPRWRHHLLPRLVRLSFALFACPIIVRAGLPRRALRDRRARRSRPSQSCSA